MPRPPINCWFCIRKNAQRTELMISKRWDGVHSLQGGGDFVTLARRNTLHLLLCHSRMAAAWWLLWAAPACLPILAILHTAPSHILHPATYCTEPHTVPSHILYPATHPSTPKLGIWGWGSKCLVGFSHCVLTLLDLEFTL